MYPYDIDPREYVRQALAMQTPTAPSGAFLPQMTPASRGYYGPTHQALSDTLAAALAKQASNAGIYVPPPVDNTAGLLSPAPSFFRMPSDFSAPVYTAPTTASMTNAPSTSLSNTAQSSSGGGRNAPEQPTYSPDFTRSNGPVGTANGFTGPYSNGGGPGNSFVDGTFLGGVGNFFNSLFNPAPTPSSIDAMGSDRKMAEVAPAPSYRLSSSGLMGGLGPQASITGTPLSAPSIYDSQTLNAVSPTTENYFRLANEDFNLAGNSDLNPVTGSMNNGPYDNGGGAGGSFGYTGSAPRGPVPDSYPAVSNNRADALLNAARNDAALQSNAGSSDTFNRASDTGPQTTRDNYTGSYGPPGGSGNEGGGGAWRMGGPVPKYGDGPPKAVHGTVHEGEYVIRPESVKLLPPGLLSALNDIYKSPNPKKTLRGLLG